MNINRLRPRVKAAIKRQRELRDGLEGSDNPLTQEMYLKSAGCVAGLEAVLWALNDNVIELGVLAHKPDGG